MSSKEILLALCNIATKQCKLHNVDVDFEKDLVLRYMNMNWQFEVQCKDGITCPLIENDGTYIRIGTDVFWYREEYYKYLDKLPIFSNEVKMPSYAYDVILEVMRHGCKVKLRAKNASELMKEYDSLQNEFSDKAKELVKSKPSNPNYFNDAYALSRHYNKKLDELLDKVHPTIDLVPRGFSSIEELKIWCDLNA